MSWVSGWYRVAEGLFQPCKGRRKHVEAFFALLEPQLTWSPPLVLQSLFDISPRCRFSAPLSQFFVKSKQLLNANGTTTPIMALIAHQTVTGAVFEDGMSDFVPGSKSCRFHGHWSDAAAVKRAFQFSVPLKSGQIQVCQENVGFSKTCRTGQAVEYGDAKLVGEKSPSYAIWDGVMQSCLWCILTILLKFKMRYIFCFHPVLGCQ